MNLARALHFRLSIPVARSILVLSVILSLWGCTTAPQVKTEVMQNAASVSGKNTEPVSNEEYAPDAIDSMLVLDYPPSEEIAHQSFLRGLQFLHANQPQVAELFYKRALANSPRNRFLAFQLAEILAGQGATGEALRVARAGEKYPGTPNSSEYHLLARLYRESEDLDSSKVYYSKAIEANEQNLRALVEYSIILEVQKDYKELARVFELMLPLLDYPEAMVDKLLRLHRVNQNDSAMVELLRVAYEAHGTVDYARLLAELLAAQGKNEESQKVVVSILDKNSQDAESWKLLVRLQLLAGQLEEARRSQAQLFSLDTTQGDVLQRLAMLEYDVGRFDSATIHFQHLVRLNSKDHVAHFFLSHLAQIKGDSTQALQHIRSALSIKPQAIPYRNQLGVIYYLSGNYSQAHQVFDSTLAVEENSLSMHLKGSAFVHQANRLQRDQKGLTLPLRKEASIWFKKSYDLDSSNTELIFDMAANYERRDSLDLAIKWFNVLIKRNPDHAPGLNYLGYMLVDSKRDVKRGAQLIDSALARDPENLAYLDSKGWSLYRLGHYAEALKVMEYVESKGMDDETLWEHMAWICEALQLKDRALEYWKKVLRLNAQHKKALERAGVQP